MNLKWQRLLCAGGPAFDDGERALLERLGVTARVERRALSDGELRWAYEHAIALLYPSRWEGFGLPVIEAMSLGAPVIAANAGAVPEVAGEEALLIDPDDELALRAAIARVIAQGRDPEAAARRRARAARFTWDDCAAAHEALYSELDRP